MPCILHAFRIWYSFPRSIKKLTENKSSKFDVTYRARAHNTLIALLGWEEVVLSEGLPRLINTSIIPAGLHWGSQPCGDPGLIWGGHITQDTGHNQRGFSPSWQRCSEEDKPTCASGTTLLGLSYRVFTRQGGTLDCVTFHMSCLGESNIQEFTSTSFFRGLRTVEQIFCAIFL